MSPSSNNMFTGRHEMGKRNMGNHDFRQFLNLLADGFLVIQEVTVSLFLK